MLKLNFPHFRSMENKQLLDKYEETKAALANEEAALKELSEQLQQR